jgi:thiol-disulfide isomerase/thioredoxin
MRRLLALIAVALVAALLVSGLREASRQSTAADDGSSFDLAAAREQLAGAPAPLASLHERSNRLLDGGPRAFERQLAALEGHPVVINKWASWCGPCRAEAPILQRQAVEHGRRVAFLGLDWRDSTSDARDFLDRHPLPFPSFEDPDGKLAAALELPNNIPVTLFLDAGGEVTYIHQGGYRSERDLAADIDRYVPGS